MRRAAVSRYTIYITTNKYCIILSYLQPPPEGRCSFHFAAVVVALDNKYLKNAFLFRRDDDDKPLKAVIPPIGRPIYIFEFLKHYIHIVYNWSITELIYVF
jgi:hypothetical protein